MLDQLALLPGLGHVGRSMTPEEAALEYSRVVLQIVPPYASLFLEEEAMLNSLQTEQVELEYRRTGFEIRPEWRAGPADHLGIELHFLAHLLDSRPELAQRFFSRHMLSWAPVCLLAISRVEAAKLYPALADLSLGVLRKLANVDSDT